MINQIALSFLILLFETLTLILSHKRERDREKSRSSCQWRLNPHRILKSGAYLALPISTLSGFATVRSSNHSSSSFTIFIFIYEINHLLLLLSVTLILHCYSSLNFAIFSEFKQKLISTTVAYIFKLLMMRQNINH